MSDEPAPQPEERTAELFDPTKTQTFLANGFAVESILGIAAGHAPDALVALSVTGRWNHGAEDRIVVLMSPQTAEELGDLRDVAAAARKDLDDYTHGRAVISHGKLRAP